LGTKKPLPYQTGLGSKDRDVKSDLFGENGIHLFDFVFEKKNSKHLALYLVLIALFSNEL